MLGKKIKRARIGLYSAGLHAYWAQFEGLEARLKGYNSFIEKRIGEFGDVFNYGLVDTPIAGQKAGEYFNASQVDMIFVHSATYFTSDCILPIHLLCKAPVVMLNLQPAAHMNYPKTSTGEWLAHCVGCPVPEAANMFNRAGIALHIVNGLLGLDKTPVDSVADEATTRRPEAIRAWNEIRQWVQAATAKRALSGARFGFLGNNYSGMLDMYSDFTMLSSQTAIHVELLEMCDLDKHLKQVTDTDLEAVKQEVEQFFTIGGNSPSDQITRRPTQTQLDWACRVAAAQRRMVETYGLDALSY